ncbi:metal-dependent transcriptional regulator [Candidatus Woesearchaeota archaeon]|nr:metal-dependent transcriptional regulator [Candidatus Woesearchaeota archaeon]
MAVIAIHTEKTEMYLKTIWMISQEKRNAKTTEIAFVLGLSPSSVTEMLQKLQGEGLLSHTQYKGCQLTSKGTAAALKLVRKERLLKKFLHDILKVPKNKARLQACKLEHYIFKETEESLCRFLGCPETCPVDNKPIPRCSECLKKYA